MKMFPLKFTYPSLEMEKKTKISSIFSWVGLYKILYGINSFFFTCGWAQIYKQHVYDAVERFSAEREWHTVHTKLIWKIWEIPIVIYYQADFIFYQLSIDDWLCYIHAIRQYINDGERKQYTRMLKWISRDRTKKKNKLHFL